MTQYWSELKAQGKEICCYLDYLWDWYGLEPWQLPDETDDEDEEIWGTTYYVSKFKRDKIIAESKRLRPHKWKSSRATAGSAPSNSNNEEKKTEPKPEAEENGLTTNEWTLVQNSHNKTSLRPQQYSG